jgi:hypothetical protein
MATVDITAENDADFFQAFQYVVANADGSNGPPIDMTGGTLEMMLRHDAADVTAVLRLGTDTGEFQITDPVNGMFSLFISQATLERLIVGSYDHSNIMTRDGRKTRIWSGTILVTAGATR